MLPNALNPDEGVNAFFFLSVGTRIKIQSNRMCLRKGRSVSRAKKNPLCLVGN